jgi:DtxR family Mn-dependent transcriptional regulator
MTGSVTTPALVGILLVVAGVAAFVFRTTLIRLWRRLGAQRQRVLAEDLDALEAAMGHPTTDRHGDSIPTAGGDLVEPPSRPVTEWPANKPARIVHLKDEPPAVFARIAATGLHPGQTIRVIERDAGRIVLADGETMHGLASEEAANIFVASDGETIARPDHLRLTALRPGEIARVSALDKGLQGLSRRRLLDLGLTPGVEVTAEMSGAFRDPVAYRVRGSLIALRNEQARHVMIEPNGRDWRSHE